MSKTTSIEACYFSAGTLYVAARDLASLQPGISSLRLDSDPLEMKHCCLFCTFHHPTNSIDALFIHVHQEIFSIIKDYQCLAILINDYQI